MHPVLLSDTVDVVMRPLSFLDSNRALKCLRLGRQRTCVAMEQQHTDQSLHALGGTSAVGSGGATNASGHSKHPPSAQQETPLPRRLQAQPVPVGLAQLVSKSRLERHGCCPKPAFPAGGKTGRASCGSELPQLSSRPNGVMRAGESAVMPKGGVTARWNAREATLWVLAAVPATVGW